MKVTTRSFDSARTGANREETTFTTHNMGNNLMVKEHSLHLVDDDPRLEAQPLYVSGLKMADGKAHNVLYVCTMANNVWAFDVDTGKALWAKPTNLGRPIKPKPQPGKGAPSASDIDLWGINILWGILSTPVIDAETDANRHVVEGILRAYDASVLDPVANADGTARLKLLWDSKHIPGNTFMFSKFCPPLVADGKLFVPTYEGRVDVYGLREMPQGPRPTNAQRLRRRHPKS